MLLYIFIGLLILFIYFTCLRTYIKLILLKLTLGNKAIIRFYPLTGDFAQIPKSNRIYGDGLKHFQKRVFDNPNVKFVLSNLMHEPLIEIYDPEYYKEVFINHELYQRADVLYHEKFTSRGILYSEGQRFRQQRQILGNHFTYDKLKERMPKVNQVVIEKIKNQDINQLHQFLVDLTTEIVMRSFFGSEALEFKLNGQSVPAEILELDEEMAAQNLFNPYVVLKRLIFGRKGDKILPSPAQKHLNDRVDRLIDFIISQINKKLSNQQNKGDYFLDIYVDAYLKQEKEFQIEILEICSMFITMFAAGSGTSVNALTMTLYFLGLEQEAQQEIRQQIVQVLNGQTEVLDIHLQQLTKLTAFIQEMFRFKAPLFAPFIRKAKKTHYIKNLKIEKGTNVLVLFAAPGWSNKHYDNPEKFDYKRWLNANPIKEDNGFVYMPFSAGMRNCIGQHMAQLNMKIILSHILMNYKITLDPKQQVRFPINFQIDVEPGNIIQFERIK
ncbi:unnamed protein product (macronuclear) [Paramecium tetraurelia]|uniref:Cytochrome P450 n=1 Tax=Paramecium tetraurelia TaxID=5888 RepID=A0CMU7_PARTE|nr:uncharacterized protein GSPATT00038731001 [Paramecium tetraurelia]CAK72114.1 unnamed protein product [Paramecium tetraurelia]|eukprot:XP_001439511.1 hypothetical protein (macronuclear) [Paramecium tetraurelia strain d4-2]